LVTDDSASDDVGDKAIAPIPVARVRKPNAQDKAASGDDPLADLRGELHRGVAADIDHILSLFPSTGENSDAKDLLDSVRKSAAGNIPQPPVGAQAVLDLCQRQDYSLYQLTQLIEGDPSLSAALLKHANASWFSVGTTPVLELRAAAHLVGANGVRASVMSSILEGATSHPGPQFDETAHMVWTHMVRVAPIARELAPLLGAEPHAAFTLGLLHDVGKLILFNHISDLRRARRREVVLSDEFLSLAMTWLHEPLGGLAILEWGMDKPAAHVVANHHRRKKPEPEDVLTEVVFLAERIDVAEQRGQTLDIAPLWSKAELTGPLEKVRAFAQKRMEGDLPSSDLTPAVAQLIEEAVHGAPDPEDSEEVVSKASVPEETVPAGVSPDGAFSVESEDVRR